MLAGDPGHRCTAEEALKITKRNGAEPQGSQPKCQKWRKSRIIASFSRCQLPFLKEVSNCFVFSSATSIFGGRFTKLLVYLLCHVVRSQKAQTLDRYIAEIDQMER